MTVEMSKTMTELKEGNAVIRVIGTGGGGNNAVKRMKEEGLAGVKLIAVNTDRQALKSTEEFVDETISIGEKLTRGLGAGADPEVGKKAAQESSEQIEAALEGSDMVFVTAGMGGGTGSGSAAVIAEIAKKKGILTVGVVTKPFGFEGKVRMRNAEAAIKELKTKVDTLIIIPNNRLLQVVNENVSMVDSFKMADDVLLQAIQSISDLIIFPGLINLDFADITSVMKEQGLAHIGIGRAQGENKVVNAAKQAISSALLESSIDGAKGVLINITGGPKLGLLEVNEASTLMGDACHEDANIIFGATIKENLNEDEVQITVVATGFSEEETEKRITSQEDKKVVKVEEPVVAVTNTQQPEVEVSSQFTQRESQPQVFAEESDIDSEIPTLFKRRR